MNIWLDDVRHPAQYGAAEDGFVFVQSAAEFFDLFAHGPVEFASLDHDIHGDLTGLDIVKWMEATINWPVNGIRIHSANPEGHAAMQAIVDRHYPRWLTDFYKLRFPLFGAHWCGFARLDPQKRN